MSNLVCPSRLNGKMNPEWYKKYYSLNGERIRSKNKEYLKRNPNKHKLYNLDYRKMAISLIYERDNGICGICHKYVQYEESSIDHILARSKGGTHASNNLQLCHRLCNAKKGSTNNV